MANSSQTRLKEPEIVRTRHGKFYKLMSGRLIPVPPRGGVVSRRQIREAIKAVAEEQRTKLG